jgi:hypothetical protein
MLKDDSRIKRSSLVPWQIIGGKTIILSTDRAMAHELNETATWIWEKLSRETSPAELASLLSNIYDIDEKTSKKDINAILHRFKSEGLIECH